MKNIFSTVICFQRIRITMGEVRISQIFYTSQIKYLEKKIFFHLIPLRVLLKYSFLIKELR